jgi:secreted PhoX family phosphatase
MIALSPTEQPTMPLARRQFLQSGAAAAVVAFLGEGCALPHAADGRLGFTAVPATLRDAVTVPPEYEAQVLYPWGTPTGIASSMPAFVPDASNSAADQAVRPAYRRNALLRAGRAHRSRPAGDEPRIHRRRLLHTDMTPWTAEKTRKSLHAMGVSVIEVS